MTWNIVAEKLPSWIAQDFSLEESLHYCYSKAQSYSHYMYVVQEVNDPPPPHFDKSVGSRLSTVTISQISVSITLLVMSVAVNYGVQQIISVFKTADFLPI